jgi:hypothetical protein
VDNLLRKYEEDGDFNKDYKRNDVEHNSGRSQKGVDNLFLRKAKDEGGKEKTLCI